jgi:hypothetical protein
LGEIQAVVNEMTRADSAETTPLRDEQQPPPLVADAHEPQPKRNLRRTDNMAPGEMRPIVTTGSTGHEIREWVGPTSFVRNPLCGHRDCRRVLRINAPVPAATLYAASDAKRAMSGGW